MRAGHRPFNLLSNQLQPIQITSASLQSQINRHSGGRINRLAVAPFPFKSPDTLESKNRHNLIDRKSLNRSMSTLNKLIFFLKKIERNLNVSGGINAFSAHLVNQTVRRGNVLIGQYRKSADRCLSVNIFFFQFN